MGAFLTPSEEPGVKRAKRSGATLIPGSSDGTLCAAIAEQMSGVARSLRRKTLSLSPPCGWVHFKLPKWVKSKLALTKGEHRCLRTCSFRLTRVVAFPDAAKTSQSEREALMHKAKQYLSATVAHMREGCSRHANRSLHTRHYLVRPS